MGFYAEFSQWLNGILASYIATNTARLAGLLEPAVVTLGVLYVMIWGVLHLMGQIEEPLLAGLKRIAVLVLVFAVGINLWLYNDVVVDTFFSAPGNLAAGIVGTYDSVGTVDQILYAGDDTATLLLAKGGILHGLSYTIAGFVVYAVVDFTALYTMFLLSLSRVALSVLLALGPLFIGLLFFEATRRFVEAWLAQLCNYAFAAVLTVLLAALMLAVLSTATQQAVAAGGSITIALAVRVCIAAGLTLLVMRQVMPMAAGLASGIALSSFSTVSGALTRAPRMLAEFGRGVMDKQTTRWDSGQRKAGYFSKKMTLGLVKAPYTVPRVVMRAVQRNTVRGSR